MLQMLQIAQKYMTSSSSYKASQILYQPAQRKKKYQNLLWNNQNGSHSGRKYFFS